MTYRICRKFTSSTFRVDSQICKIFLEPNYEFQPDHYIWNVGFTVAASRRQANDWYWKRKNRRARSLSGKLVGRSGLKAIRRGFEEVLRLRWHIPPGDGLVLDCTSADPERQFHAWSRWHRYHPEWVINTERREFYWYRPPYLEDPVRTYFDVRGVIPNDLLQNTNAENYYDCFLIRPKGQTTSCYVPWSEAVELLNQSQ